MASPTAPSAAGSSGAARPASVAPDAARGASPADWRRRAEPQLRAQVRRPPRRHPGRALRPLGGRARRRRQRGHHVAGADAARAAAQKKSLIATERDEASRQAWRAALAAIAPQRFVFLDETATPTTLTRLRARAPRGERAIGRVPHKHWHSITLLASLSTRGRGAAMVLDGALARESFDAFVEQLLLPTLAPGQIVVLDNLPVHKSARARALIEGAGCPVLFLPAYSPDFNPIEQAFAKLKQTPARGGRTDLRRRRRRHRPRPRCRHRRRCPRLFRPLRLPPLRSTPMNAALAGYLQLRQVRQVRQVRRSSIR